MREPSDSNSTVGDDLSESRSDFLSRPNNCRDNDDSDDKMDLEDEIVDDHDGLQLSSIINKIKTKRNSRLDMKLTMEPIFDSADDNEGDSTFVLKGGKMQYVRKIDFLVDDLIRKTNKTLGWVGGCTELSCIPSSIGPDPSTDRRLLCRGDRVGGAIADDEHDLHEIESQIDTSEHWSSKALPPSNTLQSSSALPDFELNDISPWQRVKKITTKEKLSGDITHSDWPIEEVAIAATDISG